MSKDSERTRLKKKKKTQLYKDLDGLFQRNRVLTETDDDGYGNCVSCGKNLFYRGSDSQGGHFIPKSVTRYNPMRWNPDNCHLQCGNCNNWKSGNLVEYRKWMVEKYGSKHVENMENNYSGIYKWQKDELIDLILHYREANLELERAKND